MSDDAEYLRNHIAISTSDKEMIKEFTQITARYEELAREGTSISARRAELIRSLIGSRTPRRTYRELGQLLGGISHARIGQILKAARKRAQHRTQDDNGTSTTTS